jgi:hypothetical protein
MTIEIAAEGEEDEENLFHLHGYGRLVIPFRLLAVVASSKLPKETS